jgi:hypothetical protein
VLLDEAGAGGVEVGFTPPPAGVRLPREVEDGAYRVVQEGLTNAMKHAPGAAVQVRLAARGEELEVEVRDSGSASSSPLARSGAGLGLEGMRERVESLGGSLEPGPLPGCGWSLSARLPVTPRAAVPPAVYAEFASRGDYAASPRLLTARVTDQGVIRWRSEISRCSTAHSSWWGLTGGGGNFGVVTEFEFRLHPVGPIVFAGMILHPPSAATKLLPFYRDFMERAPDEVG